MNIQRVTAWLMILHVILIAAYLVADYTISPSLRGDTGNLIRGIFFGATQAFISLTYWRDASTNDSLDRELESLREKARSREVSTLRT
mgnify:CR=1 FL=1